MVLLSFFSRRRSLCQVAKRPTQQVHNPDVAETILLGFKTHLRALESHASVTRSDRDDGNPFKKRGLLDEITTTTLPACSMRDLTRTGKRNKPLDRFQDLLEAYGDLPADIT